MSKVDAVKLACPVGQVPKAQRSGAIGVFGLPSSVSRTLNVAWAVFVSAVSYDLNAALPFRFVVKVPASGRLKSEYSMRIGPTIGDPSGFFAIGRFAISLVAVGAISPSHPMSTIV